MNLQPVLKDENVVLKPLSIDDFEKLYQVARDPEVWAMHPNKERYKRPVFQNFFEGALASKGAFLVVDRKTQEVLGSTRFYEFNPDTKSVLIGYTFYGTKWWGKNINSTVKKLMLDYIFREVDQVIFHVGKDNVRSVKAMTKLGAENTGEEEIAYYGEDSRTNIVFRIRKNDWLRK